MTAMLTEFTKVGDWCLCQQSTSAASFYWRLLAGITTVCVFLSYAFYTSQVKWQGSFEMSTFHKEDALDSQVYTTSGVYWDVSDDSIMSELNLSIPVRGVPKNPASPLYLNFSPKFFDNIIGYYEKSLVNCSAIFSGNQREIEIAIAVAKQLAAEERLMEQSFTLPQSKNQENKSLESDLKRDTKTWSRKFRKLTNQWYLNATRDCEWFKQTRGYITSSLTREERDFPIAFSLLVFKDLEMVERLLRSVYRPQNRYCIHVDSKSDPKFFSALKSVAACFPENVHMSSRRVDVRWGTFTVLEPELICMQDLWDMDGNTTSDGDKISDRTDNSHQPNTQRKRTKNKFKYFINLTGQEFPLKTNYELVQILKAFKGANNEEGTRERYQ